MATDTPANDTASEGLNSLPLFYRNPRPLNRTQDAELKMRGGMDFSYAARTNAVPIVVNEFPIITSYYPIVFIDAPSPVPAAIVGLHKNNNLFVEEDGSWRPSTYIPAYVRRYPFILVDDPTTKQTVLCFDRDSDLITAQGELPLFENGEPSQLTQNAMNFCGALRQQGEATDAFVKALQSQNLLFVNNAEIQFNSGGRMTVGGFQMIDENKFNELPDAIYLEWRKQGWIPLIYAHLLSQQRWQYLIDIASEKQAA